MTKKTEKTNFGSNCHGKRRRKIEYKNNPLYFFAYAKSACAIISCEFNTWYTNGCVWASGMIIANYIIFQIIKLRCMARYNSANCYKIHVNIGYMEKWFYYWILYWIASDGMVSRITDNLRNPSNSSIFFRGVCVYNEHRLREFDSINHSNRKHDIFAECSYIKIAI